MKKIWMEILSFALLVVSGLSLMSNLSPLKTSAETKIMTIADVVSKLEANQDITLTNDIIIPDNTFIDVSKVDYTGTFDGSGYKITNLSITSTLGYIGLIAQGNGAVIKNLKIDGVLTFDLSQMPTTGTRYIGGLVGYGENVKIENCEISLSGVKESYKESKDAETASLRDQINITNNTHFGLFAGRIDGNEIDKNINNCVAYYGEALTPVKFYLENQTKLSVGGFVGHLYDGQVVNSLNYGYFNIDGQALSQDDTNVPMQYVGGIVGTLTEYSASVRNCGFGGTISLKEGYVSPYIKVGAIIGGCPGVFTENNVRYDYYTQNGIQPVGDESIAQRKNLRNITSIQDENLKFTGIDKTFLQTTMLSDGTRLFDGDLESFDFSYTWDYRNSKVRLQRFETFEFSISLTGFDMSIPDKAIKIAYIANNDNLTLDDAYEMKSNIRYNKEAYLKLFLLEDCINWFEKPQIYKNGDPQEGYLQEDFVAIKNSMEETIGWLIKIPASAMTTGRYSFSVDPAQFECSVSVEEGQEEWGGVRYQNSEPESNINLEFKYSDYKDQEDNSNTIAAKENGTYTFKEWKILYETSAGVFEEDENLKKDVELGVWYREISASEKIYYSDYYFGVDTIIIHYGADDSPFTRPFKLVAVFEDDPATIDFSFNKKHIHQITIDGDEYKGVSYNIAKSKNPVLVRITTKAGYQLNVQSFERNILKSIQKLDKEATMPEDGYMTVDPSPDDNGRTTYTFRLNMKQLVNKAAEEGALEIEAVNLEVVTIKGSGTGGDRWLWLKITAPIVAGIAAVAGVIWLIIRKRGGRGGKGSKGGKNSAPKAKATSYKDYYV